MRYIKKIMIAARVISLIFTPFYLPTVGLLALFTLSYLSLLPTSYKLMVLADGAEHNQYMLCGAYYRYAPLLMN